MTSPAAPASPVHALVVEDDPTVQAMLRAWLHLEGGQCTVQADIAGAREALASGTAFDILICDLHLPDGEGTDIVADLPDAHAGLPVIFLTGEPTLESAVRSVSLHVAAYLIKPPDTDELRRVLQREVSAYRSRRAIRSSRERLAAWDRDLASMQDTEATSLDRPFVDYIQVSIRHLTGHLVDLERSLALIKDDDANRRALNQGDLVQSIRTTIGILEQSRRQFKSRELGDLRRDLQAVLDRVDTPPNANKS